MRPLREALEEWRPRRLRAGEPLGAVRNLWTPTVGPDVAAHTQPVAIERTTLVVRVDSSAWAAQLSFLAESILMALRVNLPESPLDRVRFRVGQATQAQAGGAPRALHALPVTQASELSDSVDLAGALERFRARVIEQRRANQAAGWKECEGCAAAIAPGPTRLCVTCGNARTQERERCVARLLFESPWVGYAGSQGLVEDLTEHEYEVMRRRLLARWRGTLELARKRGALGRDGRERRIAGSYLVLKTGIRPDRLAVATIRNELGDELYTLLYESDR